MTTMYRCGGCGYIHDGEGGVLECPVCDTPKGKFRLLPEAEAGKVELARYVNLRQMKLHDLFSEVIEVADEGCGKEGSDAHCNRIFVEAKNFAQDMMRQIEAVMAERVGRGEWG